jgi:hypothetical protein
MSWRGSGLGVAVEENSRVPCTAYLAGKAGYLATVLNIGCDQCGECVQRDVKIVDESPLIVGHNKTLLISQFWRGGAPQ